MPRKAKTPEMTTRPGTNKAYVRLKILGKWTYYNLEAEYGTQEAQEAYYQLLLDLSRHGGCADFLAEPPGMSLTVRALCNDYTVATQDKDPRTVDRIKHTVSTVLKLYGSSPAAAFGPNALRHCRQVWVEKGLARRTIMHRVNCVRTLFRWAVAHELVPAGVLEALKALEPLPQNEGVATAKRQPVRREDVEKVLPLLSPTLRAMVELQMITGMRPGEVCALRPCDVDQNWKSLGGTAMWLYRLPQHKGTWRGHCRDVPLGPKAQAVLAPFLEREPHRHCFSPAETKAWYLAELRKNRKSKVQPSQKDRSKADPKKKPRSYFDTHSYGKALAGKIKKAGVTWTPHQLRHLVGTLVKASHGDEGAQAVLGHHDAETTKIYAKRVELAAQIMAELG